MFVVTLSLGGQHILQIHNFRLQYQPILIHTAVFTSHLLWWRSPTFIVMHHWRQVIMVCTKLFFKAIPAYLAKPRCCVVFIIGRKTDNESYRYNRIMLISGQYVSDVETMTLQWKPIMTIVKTNFISDYLELPEVEGGNSSWQGRVPLYHGAPWCLCGTGVDFVEEEHVVHEGHCRVLKVEVD